MSYAKTAALEKTVNDSEVSNNVYIFQTNFQLVTSQKKKKKKKKICKIYMIYFATFFSVRADSYSWTKPFFSGNC